MLMKILSPFWFVTFFRPMLWGQIRIKRLINFHKEQSIFHKQSIAPKNHEERFGTCLDSANCSPKAGSFSELCPRKNQVCCVGEIKWIFVWVWIDMSKKRFRLLLKSFMWGDRGNQLCQFSFGRFFAFPPKISKCKSEIIQGYNKVWVQ